MLQPLELMKFLTKSVKNALIICISFKNFKSFDKWEIPLQWQSAKKIHIPKVQKHLDNSILIFLPYSPI